MLPGDPRDTFADVTNNEPRTWELALPNGLYRVSLTCGDPNTTATHHVALEGQVVVAGVLTSGNQFLQVNDIPVTIVDGRLTVAVGAGTQITHTKLCALEIASQDALVLVEPVGDETFCAGVQPTCVGRDSCTWIWYRVELLRVPARRAGGTR